MPRPVRAAARRPARARPAKPAGQYPSGPPHAPWSGASATGPATDRGNRASRPEARRARPGAYPAAGGGGTKRR